MKLKDEEEPYYLVDFCRKKDNQQIKVVDTDDDEMKLFLFGIFSNKRKQNNARTCDGTLIKVRKVSCKSQSCDRLLSMPVYNISPSQARIYTQKCIEYYFRDK